ncbi:MAG: 30S ribosomal protein S17e [Nanoarchaeota archaeon]
MGKIKSKLIKRTALKLIEKGIPFEGNFEYNKKVLGSNTMPSKKIRNQMAGYLVRLKISEAKAEARLAMSLKQPISK